MFDKSQNSIRWTVLTRYNNKAHNTLSIDDKNQWVESHSNFINYSNQVGNMHAVADLTPAYSKQASRVLRAVGLIQNRYAVVEDRIDANTEADNKIVWNMTTPASTIQYFPSRNLVLLTGMNELGEKWNLYVKISLEHPDHSPGGYSVSLTPATPAYTFEKPMNGLSYFKIRFTIKKGCRQHLKCMLIPDELPENLDGTMMITEK
jgi:hypothetical protein